MTEFGLLLPTREAVMREGTPNFGQMLELAERAEAMGFSSVWVGDSVLARPRFEPLTTLAAVAARTTQVKLGTAVLVPALRQPVVLANEIATLDHIAGGRLILGLGIGGAGPTNAREFAACGFPIAHRVELFEEGVSLMRRLWSGEEVTFQGRYFQLEKARLGFRPLQQPHPPLWLAGSVDRSYRRLLRLGDGWFPISSSAEVFARGWERITTLGADLGRDTRDLHRCLYTTLAIDEDEQKAQREMQTFIETYYGVPYEILARGTGLCAGSPARCIEWTNDFIAAGVQTMVIRFGASDQAVQLDRWASLVKPHLQATTTA